MTRPVSVPRPAHPVPPPHLRALRPAGQSTPKRADGAAPRPDLERLVVALGTDPAFAEAVIGDLAEEHAERIVRDGAGAARRWYAREALRSAPHLIRHAVAHVIRRGDVRQRARLAAALAGLALVLSAAGLAWLTRNGPPARLIAGPPTGTPTDGLVVNSRGPTQLPMRVLDARGHALPPADVRYARLSGVPVPVTPHGEVTCTQRGDAVVGAALGALATRIVVHCEPVRALRGVGWGNFVVGDTARTLGVDAVGADGRPVTRIAARLRVENGTVAALDGARLRPLRPGGTIVDVRVGDHVAGMLVTVFEPVPTFAGLRPDQRVVAAPVRLAPGASLTSPLPVGLFSLGFTAAPAAGATPGLHVAGPVMCMPALRPGVAYTRCVARGPGATVTVAAPAGPPRGPGAPCVVGSLALEREAEPAAPAPTPRRDPPL